MNPENEKLKDLIAQCEHELNRQRTKSEKEETFFYVSNLKKGTIASKRIVMLDGVAVNRSSGLSKIEIKLNDSKIGDLKAAENKLGEESYEQPFKYPLRFKEGINHLVIVAEDRNGITDSTVIDSIIYKKPEGKVWAVLFGVAEYKNISHLKYSIKDVEENFP